MKSFYLCQRESGRRQSSMPARGMSARRDMQALAGKVLGRLHFTFEQVQDLTPTPMTLSSVMFYTGENPYTDEKVYVARSQDEKRRQKSYFFGWKDRRGER